MNEDTIQEVGLEPIVDDATPAEPKAPELNEVEQEAFKEGWRPKDQFEGDENRWIPADEFMRRKPLFAKIDELKSETYHTRKELQEMRSVVKTLGEQYKKARDVEYARAIKELQSVKKAAFEEQDFDTLERADEQLDQLKIEKQRAEIAAKQEIKQQMAQPSPEYLTWAQNNPWYAQDQEMRVDADAIALAYINAKRDATPTEVYAAVSQKIRKMYPDKFEKPSRPNPVDSGRSSAPAPKKSERYSLTPAEEDVARTLERSGVMTRAEYIESLKKYEERK